MSKLVTHDFVQTLRGQTLRFPNLNAVVEGWPRGCSPHLKCLRGVLEKELLKYVSILC